MKLVLCTCVSFISLQRVVSISSCDGRLMHTEIRSPDLILYKVIHMIQGGETYWVMLLCNSNLFCSVVLATGVMHVVQIFLVNLIYLLAIFLFFTIVTLICIKCAKLKI